jgi:hypothetical protein
VNGGIAKLLNCLLLNDLVVAGLLPGGDRYEKPTI